VQGIYPYGSDGTHINGVASLKSHKLIATGDDYGLVNIYHDPCLEDFNKGKSYRGHSEHVTRVKFAMDGKYLISVGGYDQTIIQWKREGEDTDEEDDAYLSSSSEDIEEEEKKTIERKYIVHFTS
jgi:WD40 repeat protein